jgi:hypothetical protein
MAPITMMTIGLKIDITDIDACHGIIHGVDDIVLFLLFEYRRNLQPNLHPTISRTDCDIILVRQWIGRFGMDLWQQQIRKW